MFRIQNRGSLLAKYFSFLQKPTYTKTPYPAPDVIRTIWQLFAFQMIAFYIPIVIGIRLLSSWVPSIRDNHLGDVLSQMPLLQVILLIVVIGPFLEEVVFRLPLRFSARNLSIPLGLVLFFVGSLVLQRSEISPIGGVIGLVSVGAVIGLTMTALNRINRHQGDRFFSRHCPWLVYGTVIVFGLLHIPNFPRSAWFIGPLLVMPQMLGGLAFAYVRLRFGFGWAVFAHGLHNFLVASPMFLMRLGSAQFQQQLLSEEPPTNLLPQDMLLVGILMVWVLGLLGFMIWTMRQLFREWRSAS